MSRGISLNPDRIEELYHGQGMTQAEVARELGVSQPKIAKAMRRNGVETRSRGRSRSDHGRRTTGAIGEEPEEVERLYWGEGLTQLDLARRFDCTAQTVSNFMDRHVIEARGPEERGGPSLAVEDFMEDVAEVARDLGRPPSTREYRRMGGHSVKYGYSQLGSWAEVKERAAEALGGRAGD